MFMVTEEDAAAIRAAFEQGGEFSAAIELRRRFPLIASNEQARSHARAIASWRPLPPGGDPAGGTTARRSRTRRPTGPG
jgi:hypothetical protein